MNILGGRTAFRTLAVVALLAAAAAAPCAAQLTGRQITSGAVEQYDAKRFADVERAVAVFYRGDPGAAREALLSAREAHPELAPADVYLALLHFSLNRRTEAEAALDQAAAREPGDPEAYLIEAELALREGRPLAAKIGLDYAEQSLESYTANPYRRRLLEVRVHAGYAVLYENRGNFDEALKNVELWLKFDPKNPLAVGTRGRVQFRSGDYGAARATFVELEKLDKDAPPADVAMGRLYTDKGLFDEALRSMQAALAAGENDPRTRLTVADWAISAGRLDLAREQIEAALQQDPNSLGGNVLKARLARDADDAATAQKLLDAAVLRAPSDFAASNELARTLGLSDDPDKRKTGLEYASRNYRLVTNRATAVGREATITLAWLLLRNDREEDAERVLLTLPDGSTVSNENAYLAAQIYLKLGRRELALQALRASLTGGVYFPGRAKAEKLLEELTRN